MVEKSHKNGDLETMEKNPNTLRELEKIRFRQRTSLDVGKYKKRLLAYCP